MKKLAFVALLFLALPAFAEKNYKIQPRTYLFSTHYDVYSGDQYMSTIENNYLQWQTTYSLCNEQGEYAKGTARLLSAGAFFNSLREIDVSDYRGAPLGFIQGTWLTTAKGKFSFYDARNNHFATAYIDHSGASVTIVDSKNDRAPYALFRRSYIPNGGDYFWEIREIQEDKVDPSLLFVFASFVTDACWPREPKQNEAVPSWESLMMLEIIKELGREDS